MLLLIIFNYYFVTLNSIFVFDILGVFFTMYSKVLLILFVLLVRGGRPDNCARLEC